MRRLIVIDNYDSFTYNLVQLFRRHTLEIQVYRADRITVGALATLHPDYLVVSPGPKNPAHSGISIPAIRRLYQEIPILGVCLGMQAINEAFGGKTVRSLQPVHGKTSAVLHDATHLFRGLPSPFTAMRYHSLTTADHSAEFTLTARTADGMVMALSHRQYPLHGVQFHPESFCTEYGPELIANFLRLS